MESLVNYGSDDESGDYNDVGKSNHQSQQRMEEDANYDEIGMDESSEESNNNHTESHFTPAAREKQESSKSTDSLESAQTEEIYKSCSFQAKDKSKSCFNDEFSQNSTQEKKKKEVLNVSEILEKREGDSLPKNDKTSRRHSSDMEMDDGEDDLDNFKDIKSSDYVQNHKQKSVENNFTKEKNIEGDSTGSFKSYHIEKNTEGQGMKEDKMKRNRGKVLDYKKRDDFKERRKDEEKGRESDRDRKREGDKYRDDKDRRRTPERHRKRSHSPDRRDRERDRDRDYDRERDRCRSRERDRDRDRPRDYIRDRDRDRDGDRDRDYRSSDRRSPKHFRRSSKSPERSWKVRKLEKKAAVLNKLGIELKTDISGNLTPRQLLGEQLKAQIQEVEAKTGVTLPTYYNPGVMNPLKYAQQIQKRKLLWGNKNNEAKASENPGQSSSTPSTVKQWEAATFKGDNDGKMTEKFKRLMGIKGDTSACNLGSASSKPSETKEIIQKQEEMFSNMEAQYQVARMATHTHRGVGLGFGTFQVPPR